MRALILSTALIGTLLLPFAAQAHKAWMAPSKTVLNVGQWITVDAAASTDPFVIDHNALGLEQLVITAPDGSLLSPENVAKGRLRSTFDVQLNQAGTYKLAVLRDGVSASWDDAGKRGRWPPRGETFSEEGLARALPKSAKDVKITRALSRLESFVTAGKPNATALQATGDGLELAPVTGVNDLYLGEPATFQLLLDGKPASGVTVELIADGMRYRSAVDAVEKVTDAQGRFTVEWTQAGLYWLGATLEDKKGTKAMPYRRFSYSAVFEVLSQ